MGIVWGMVSSLLWVAQAFGKDLNSDKLTPPNLLSCFHYLFYYISRILQEFVAQGVPSLPVCMLCGKKEGFQCVSSIGISPAIHIRLAGTPTGSHVLPQTG